MLHCAFSAVMMITCLFQQLDVDRVRSLVRQIKGPNYSEAVTELYMNGDDLRYSLIVEALRSDQDFKKTSWMRGQAYSALLGKPNISSVQLRLPGTF